MSIENRSLKLPHSSGVLCGQKRSIFGEGIDNTLEYNENPLKFRSVRSIEFSVSLDPLVQPVSQRSSHL